jgi:hypothetical protein
MKNVTCTNVAEARRTGCMVCGSELTYSEKTANQVCVYCRHTFETSVQCSEGHYVCDRCHSMEAMEQMREFCLHSVSTDPMEIADMLMKNPKVKMHGPEHHFLVPAVLLTAYYNLREDHDLLKKKLQTALSRAEYVPGGFCGSHGNCGAAVGTGIFISVVTRANSLSRKEWQLSNLMTARSLETIAMHGGPRCCKRNTFLAIQIASRFANEFLNAGLPEGQQVICSYSDLNYECIKTDCPFFSIPIQ